MLPKTLAPLLTNGRVSKVWSEADSGDGYWVMLKPGFADLTHDPHCPTHTIHEWKVADILARMRDVRPCNCADCTGRISPAKES